MEEIKRIRNERISLRVTKEERKFIEDNAKKSMRSISAYVVRLCEQTPIYVIEGIPELTAEIRHIGNNINQLTKIANTQKYLDKNVSENLQDIKSELNGIQKKISDLLFKTQNNSNEQIDNSKILNEISQLKELIVEQKISGE
jgi:uncharacterized protein (DUF1778 family)